MCRLLNTPSEILIQILDRTSHTDHQSFSRVSKRCRGIINNTPELKYAHLTADETSIFGLLSEINGCNAWNWIQNLTISSICSTHQDPVLSYIEAARHRSFHRRTRSEVAEWDRPCILGLATLITRATKVSSLTFRRRHSQSPSCCYNIVHDNNTWHTAFWARSFTSLTSVEVDLPSICFVRSKGRTTFLHNMPNLKSAKIHHAFVVEWEEYQGHRTYSLEELAFVSSGTQIASGMLSEILSRCPQLRSFVYHISPGEMLLELNRLMTSLARLRVDGKLVHLRSVYFRVTKNLERAILDRIWDLKSHQIQVHVEVVDADLRSRVMTARDI
jgi:hypothetical protein